MEEYLLKYEFYIKNLREFSRNAILFLASAVSDYHIPDEILNEHKIQSSTDNLNISLYPVKKDL